jgi:hypothetical protein
MNKLKYASWVISAVLLVFLTGCVSRAAIKKDYDFTKIKRVGVLSFSSRRAGIGEAIADEFMRQLLMKNINVVERAQLASILQEQDLGTSGYLDPATAKKAKALLGVDVIITGTVTEYSPHNEYTYPSTNTTTIRTIKGETKTIERPSEIVITNAQVGISARMIDVETGSVVWINSYTYDAMDIQTAIEWTVSDLLDSLKEVWPQLKK